MKRYVKSFVDPLHALQFKSGIEFVDDPFFKVKEPQKKGSTEWVLIIEDCNEDEDDEGIIEIMDPRTLKARERRVLPSGLEMIAPVVPQSVKIDDDAVQSAESTDEDEDK